MYDTIIIGGGIAGLACAKTLTDNNADFILITTDIGGRIKCSRDGKVNYGAYFIGKDYKHLLPYVKKGKRFSNFDLTFHEQESHYNILGILLHPVQLMRMIKEIYKFRLHYEKIKDAMPNISSKNAIEGDPYLLKLFNTRTDKLIEEIGIKDIAEKYINKFMYAILFLRPNEYYGLDFMRWIQYAIIPVYDFSFDEKKIIREYKNRIVIGSVEKILPTDPGYLILTSDGGEYYATNVVVSTPISTSQKLLGIPKIREPINASALHIRGFKKKTGNNNRFDVFAAGSDIMNVAQESDGEYILYYKGVEPPLNELFYTYQIIERISWKPAFNLNGNTLLETKQGENLYLAGDYNLVGMEDAFISGIYAANKILNKTKD